MKYTYFNQIQKFSFVPELYHFSIYLFIFVRCEMYSTSDFVMDLNFRTIRILSIKCRVKNQQFIHTLCISKNFSFFDLQTV